MKIYRFPDCLKKYHVSAPYFSKAFKQVSGENLMSYISRVRMEKAIQYMEQGISLTDIAERVDMTIILILTECFGKLRERDPENIKRHGKVQHMNVPALWKDKKVPVFWIK